MCQLCAHSGCWGLWKLLLWSQVSPASSRPTEGAVRCLSFHAPVLSFLLRSFLLPLNGLLRDVFLPVQWWWWWQCRVVRAVVLCVVSLCLFCVWSSLVADMLQSLWTWGMYQPWEPSGFYELSKQFLSYQVRTRLNTKAELLPVPMQSIITSIITTVFVFLLVFFIIDLLYFSRRCCRNNTFCFMFDLCFNIQTIKNGNDTFLIGFAVCSQIIDVG